MDRIVTINPGQTSQCKQPRGWLGRLILRNMNSRHSKVTDWGLAKVSVESGYAILDVGCGGGRTLSKLAAVVGQGKVYGVDFSDESVAVSKKTNAQWIRDGRVEVRPGPVSQLPFPDGMFDVVTAVETHFWWPDLPKDFREVSRVLKPGGRLAIIAEVYKGANTRTAKMIEMYAAKVGMRLLDLDEHRQLLAGTGFSDVQVIVEEQKGWIFATGKKG
jgi:ubiquinone/menaquinone biosynthesis C-methylase UbiE